MDMPGFGRHPRYDEASKRFPIRAAFSPVAGAPIPEPRSYSWSCEAFLDQGNEGACVGYSLAHELAARPDVVAADTWLAQLLYTEAKKIDYWPGEDYDGTSVLAGLKTAQRLHLIESYHWGFGLAEGLAGISRTGPAILGCWWYEGMWDTDEHGMIHPTGDRVGGHAILVNKVSVPRRTVTVHNSWGRGWGRDGEAEIPWDEFEFLLHDEGELAFPMRRRLG